MATKLKGLGNEPDVYLDISEQKLYRLVESGRPVLIGSEPGMGSQAKTVAQVLHEKRWGKSSVPLIEFDGLSFLSFDNGLHLLELLTGNQRAVQRYTRPLQAQPLNYEPAIYNAANNGIELTVFVKNLDWLPFGFQFVLASCVHCGKVWFQPTPQESIELPISAYIIGSSNNRQSFAKPKGNNPPQLMAELLKEFLPGQICLLPLRECRDIFDIIVADMLRSLAPPASSPNTDSAQMGITESAIDGLMEYAWPGNYDELRCILARAALMSSTPPISEADTEEAINETGYVNVESEPVLKYDSPPQFKLAEVMEATEAFLIERILQAAKTQKEASIVLGFKSPQAFAERLKKLNIEIPEHFRKRRYR